jgi:predicted PurR-regulated permease PerM
MDTDALLELLPHYVALLVLIFAALSIIGALADGVDFWLRLVVAAVTAFAYRPLVVRLGVAPSVWE